MADIPRQGSPVSTVPIIAQAAVPDNLAGTTQIYSDASGALFQKSPSGTVTALGGGGGSGITALTGDVTASGTGSVPATVALVGAQTAAVIAAGAVRANAGVSTNTPSTLVARDASGNFVAGLITASLSGTATNFSGALTGDVTGTQGATTVAAVGGASATSVNSATGKVLAGATAGWVLTATGIAGAAAYAAPTGGGTYTFSACSCGTYQRAQTGGYFMNVGVALSQDMFYYMPPGITGRIVALSGYCFGDVATGTIYFSVYKNGAAIGMTSTSITVPTAVTAISATGTTAIAPGDQVSIALFASSATPKINSNVCIQIAVP